MNIVGVKHKPKDKIYWFEAPHDKIEFEGISLGDSCMCLTKKGHQVGWIVAKIEDATGDEVKAITRRSELSHILGVWKNVQINDIKIPEDFTKTTPRRSKITLRREEFLMNGSFGTNVTIKYNSVYRDTISHPLLVDGYTAYLVAKELGHKTLRCYHKFVFI